MINIINWWATWWLLGIVSLPVTIRLFKSLNDEGYAVARLLGVLVISYVVWLLASIKVMPFSLVGVWSILIIWTLINGYLYKINQKDDIEIIKIYWWKWIRIEMIFVFFLAFWSLIRSFYPDINGLEKFMDYGFMNSILRSDYFPPHDMWYAGGSINYYYYGHYVSALVTKISQVPSQISYNLMISTILANAAIAIYSLVGSIVEWTWGDKKNSSLIWVKFGGTLAVFLLLLRGNLHLGAYELGKMLSSCETRTDGTMTNCVSKYSGINKGWFPDVSKPYWYPDATRYIPYTIHEFPIYSFVVADLHAHLINLPFVLLYLSLLLQLIKESYTKLGKWLVAGWILGIFYMTNAWDWPIYMLLTGMCLLYLQFSNILKFTSKQWLWIQGTGLTIFAALVGLWGIAIKTTLFSSGNDNFEWPLIIASLVLTIIGVSVTKQIKIKDWANVKDVLYGLVLPCLIILGISILVALPFHLKFEQIAQGVGLVTTRSEISKLLTLWGWDLFTGLILIGIMVLSKLGKIKQIDFSLDGIMVVIWLLGIILIIIPEFIYVKDIYIQEYHRANTMFKLVYQSWTLFSIVSAYTVIRLIRLTLGRVGNIIRVPLIMVIILMLWQMARYPVIAINSYYPMFNSITGELNIDKMHNGLDGELWLKDQNANEYALLKSLKKIEGSPVILEAPGDSYTEFNRFSSYTGLPTVEGWLVHEWLWRGSYDGPGRRASEVEHIYTAADENSERSVYDGPPIPNVKELIKKYGIKYIIIGEKERDKYGRVDARLNVDLIKSLADEIFVAGDSRLYKVRE